MELFVGESVAPGELYVLDEEAFYIDVPADESTCRVTVEQLRNGAAPGMALGPGHRRFAYATIVRLCFDQVRLDIDVDYKDSKGEAQDATLLFRERPAFLAACDALRARLASRFTESTYRPTALQAAWSGAFVGSLVIFLTLMFAQAARTAPAAEIGSDEKLMRTVFGVVGGSTGLLVLGLLLAAGPLFYAYTRTRRRSEFQILQQHAYAGPAGAMTVLKYVGLGVVLFFCVKLALR
jgi:hypothetical protein